MRLMPLGTNGYMPSYCRLTMCFLLRAGDRVLVLDAGTGMARLAEEPAVRMLEGIETLDLVLTHYHLDHVVGLSYLPGVWPDKPVRIWAPCPPMVDADPAEALCQLIHPPLFPLPLPEFPMRVEVERMRGDRVEIGGLELRLRSQEHPGGSVALRIGDAIAYVTDTVADDATADFAAGVDLLLHEVWAGAADGAGGVGHSAAADVARLAEKAGVRRLMPVHHNPRHSNEDLKALAAELAEGTTAEVILPEEGTVYELGE